ncbi:hypothetical protein BSM4216_0778 [Bacillus smithii]|nr:hypothetical protein BSM4216_0778 [Bacillus smithii]
MNALLPSLRCLLFYRVSHILFPIPFSRKKRTAMIGKKAYENEKR